MCINAGLMTSLPASDPGSAAVWGSKKINSRPQFCLCLAWNGCPSNDDDDVWFNDNGTNTTVLCLNIKTTCFATALPISFQTIL